MTGDSIQRLLGLLIFIVITAGVQIFIIRVVVKHSIKNQILLNIFIAVFWGILAFYSVYKEYRNFFFYVCMGFMLCYIITSFFTIKGYYYDSRKISPKYKRIIAIGGFVAIILSLLRVLSIYSFLAIIVTLLLLTYFIDYKNYSTYYENNI